LFSVLAQDTAAQDVIKRYFSKVYFYSENRLADGNLGTFARVFLRWRRCDSFLHQHASKQGGEEIPAASIYV
jgi:hypothetical protein